MTLVDTSVWVDYFRDAATPEAGWLEHAILDDADLCVCGPVLTEVLQGVRSDTELATVQQAMRELVYLETSREAHEAAAAIYRAARKRGKPIRNAVDCVIAACAIAHDVPVLQSDRDFASIASVSQLRLITP
ncbi:MAG TPA: PIN domain-containing protein [Planctomycetota bacterium]|nr:PIN domain-containing protein [Planctomycetota bacterium]HRR81200.1 PIN domain-containing protein [Planctomycetota bacterium]HRT95216.1 PIN domain-containing protein [Planctomycetota bacterium]